MIIANIILPIASVTVLFCARMVELGTRRDTIPGTVKENLTFRIFMVAGLLMFAGSLVEFILRELTLRWPTFLAGWILAMISFLIRRRAILALGRFWSLHVEIRPQHQMVQTGPYRWVRHPAYLSMILELISGALILNTYWSLAIVLLIFVPTLIVRYKLEEAAMIEKFGRAYQTYRQSTPALVPYKWPQTQ